MPDLSVFRGRNEARPQAPDAGMDTYSGGENRPRMRNLGEWRMIPRVLLFTAAGKPICQDLLVAATWACMQNHAAGPKPVVVVEDAARAGDQGKKQVGGKKENEGLSIYLSYNIRSAGWLCAIGLGMGQLMLINNAGGA